MKKLVACLLSAVGLFPFACPAQQAPSGLPDAPKPSQSTYKPGSPSYSPPTQDQRLKAYLRSTYGLLSIGEAGVRGGIDQARDSASGWPEGGQGYADRFGSAMGEIAIRGTTEYLFADLFREDIRHQRCYSPCPVSAFKRAFEDTFTARKGEDGHRTFSVARIVGPVSGSAVAVNTWYPATSGRSETVTSVFRSYGFAYGRNLIREFFNR